MWVKLNRRDVCCFVYRLSFALGSEKIIEGENKIVFV